ncbi:hypothetical protein Vafri_16927 [Volvox africanus]|uniref:Uncharacterized protein n=1 Tax=Volvox africanus TaxID=51714 RepID=A0A8J4F9K3_9CHLO|nr:hypothetical protein Vafri_16927 [Volvox africanus]
MEMLERRRSGLSNPRRYPPPFAIAAAAALAAAAPRGSGDETPSESTSAAAPPLTAMVEATRATAGSLGKVPALTLCERLVRVSKNPNSPVLLRILAAAAAAAVMGLLGWL